MFERIIQNKNKIKMGNLTAAHSIIDESSTIIFLAFEPHVVLPYLPAFFENPIF